mgnify:CR=1 FL=1
MKPDGLLTTHKMIVHARKQVALEGRAGALDKLAAREPALAEYLDHASTLLVGKLALSGAPTETVQMAREEALSAMLTAIAALRKGHYKLWKDTFLGKRLVQLDPSLDTTGKQGVRNHGSVSCDQENLDSEEHLE